MQGLSKRYLWLAATLVAFFALPADWLELNRSAVMDSGQIWRLVTAHWTHLNTVHLLLNVLGVLLLVKLFDPQESWREWLLCLAVLALGTSVSLLLFAPELAWYRGFSGCLHGLFIYEAIRCFRYQRGTCVLVLTAVVAKLAINSLGIGGHETESLIGAPVIDAAHVAGALIGALIALGQQMRHGYHATLKNGHAR